MNRTREVKRYDSPPSLHLSNRSKPAEVKCRRRELSIEGLRRRALRDDARLDA